MVPVMAVVAHQFLVCCLLMLPHIASTAELALGPTSAAPMMRRLWRTAPSGAADRLDTIPSTSALVRALPRWDTGGLNETVLFTERISRVRLLGGWKPAAPTGDCLTVPAGQTSEYVADWPCLFTRIDSVTAQNLGLVVVFDNVPWAFVRNTSGASGAYGNAKAPDDDLRPLFARYVTELVSRLAGRYGKTVAAQWQWRAATEPNCECHWLSTPEDYLWFYDTLASAVKTTLGPTARFGPGNMPRGMQMQMVDTVLRRLTNAAATKYPPDVLGISYYGGAGNGYRHSDMQSTYTWMHTYAKLATPQAAVHFMEYGTLENPMRQPSNEPSMFGTAWTAGGLVVALRNDIEELYHWHFLDHIGSVPQQTLIYGWAWLLGVCELLVGLPATALSTDTDFSVVRNRTSVTGIGAMDEKDRAVYAMVTVFNDGAYNASSDLSTPVPVTLSLPLPAVAHQMRGEIVADQWSLNSSSSWYDEIWRDLSDSNLLKRHSDGHTYRVKRMASDEGARRVGENFDKYERMMLGALKPTAFEGQLSRNGTHAVLEWVDAPPSVRIVRVRAAA